MNLLPTLTVLLSVSTLVLCQRYLYGREQPYSRGQVYSMQQYQPSKAVAVLQGKIKGVINFEQIGYDRVRVYGTVEGLSPGPHGFHVHQYGDTTDGCKSAGGHFNPSNRQHGSPADFERHAGDLGNIMANKNGVANVDVIDYFLSLTSSSNSIMGRAVVVHENEDDLGRGRHEQSKTTGNAGGRLGCGVIGWAQVKDTSKGRP